MDIHLRQPRGANLRASVGFYCITRPVEYLKYVEGAVELLMNVRGYRLRKAMDIILRKLP